MSTWHTRWWHSQWWGKAQLAHHCTRAVRRSQSEQSRLPTRRRQVYVCMHMRVYACICLSVIISWASNKTWVFVKYYHRLYLRWNHVLYMCDIGVESQKCTKKLALSKTHCMIGNLYIIYIYLWTFDKVIFPYFIQWNCMSAVAMSLNNKSRDKKKGYFNPKIKIVQ